MDDPTHEEWRPVVGYEGLYEVSDLGRVRRLRATVAPRILVPFMRGGHRAVNLSINGRARTTQVHRIAAIAFLGPSSLPLVRHLDDNPDNNRVANLAWGTVSDNSLDSVRNGGHRNSRKTACKDGHPFTAANTIARRGTRECRTCENARSRRRYHAGER